MRPPPPPFGSSELSSTDSAQLSTRTAVRSGSGMGSSQAPAKPGSGARDGQRSPSRSRVRRAKTYTAECRVGRLVEARLFTLTSVEEVTQFQSAMRAAFVVAGSRSIICADWRAADLLAPD